MNIVVFGAAGFVGSYLMPQLENHTVYALDKDDDRLKELCKRFRKIKGFRFNIEFPSFFPFLPYDVDCVIHLATLQPDQVSEKDFDPVKYIKINTIGTINILKYCVSAKIPKYIQVVSHRSVIRNGGRQDEFAPYHIDYESDFSEFAISEMAAIEMVKSCAAKNSFNHIILRVPSIFGYGSHLEGYQKGEYKKTGFQTFIDAARRGGPITAYGDTTACRDIVYVKDVARAIVKAIEVKDASGLYNISGGRTISLTEEIFYICDVFAPNGDCKIINRLDIPNNVEFCLYNIEKAEKELGWLPWYHFKGMLIDYMKEEKAGTFNFLLRKE
jgi:UDP-glucose 4-epimerase